MMKKTMLVLGLVLSAPLVVQAEGRCGFQAKSNGGLILNAGNNHTLELDIQRTQENLRVLDEVCEATYAATQCRAYSLPRDEYQHHAYDGAHQASTNLGRERAELTIGSLPSWIAQFATQNYRRDQSGVYYSVGACEANRSRVAIEVAKRVHDGIEDKEEAQEAQRRKEATDQYWQNDYGPKY